MKRQLFFWLFIIIAVAFCSLLLSCKGKGFFEVSEVSLVISDSDSFYIDKHLVVGSELRKELETLCCNDNDNMPTDKNTRHYYRSGNAYLWINRLGVDSAKTESLLAHLNSVTCMGFSPDAFDAKLIADDFARMRNLTFDNDTNTINKVMARMEYRLTKSYLRYVAGQRFGYINPYAAFNKLDLVDTAATRRYLGYRRLYDANTLRPDSAFIVDALNRISGDDMPEFLAASRPQSEEYAELEKMLAETTDKERRRQIICNMEWARWHEAEPPVSEDGRRVVVNIPSFYLYAYCPDSISSMAIGCGTQSNKTPLFSSKIERVEFNPQWHIPMSIIRNEVAHHAGDEEWFDARNYYIAERKTGDVVPASEVSQQQLLSGAYRVSQRGGKGNSLGRVVFRFPNKFAVFLHDTSSPGFFKRKIRRVSHGCVRVQRPFDLARFMVGDKADKWESDTTYVTSSRSVSPRVPIYIIYRTMYKEPNGEWGTFPDVYGYDEIIYNRIAPLIKKEK